MASRLPNLAGRASTERHRRQLSVQDPGHVQAARELGFHIFIEIASIPFRQFQHMKTSDVHRGFGRLQMQERGI